MNKKTGIVIGIVILLLLLLGVGIFLMKKPQSQIQTPKTEQPGTTQNAAPETAQGTLKSLLAMGKSVQCSFSNAATDSAKVSGTLYVAGGKMRGDFQSTSGDTSINSHMIADSQNSYIWTDMNKQGFKFSITNQQQTNTAVKSQGPDMNQTIDYSCQDWVTDSSVFTLPSDITFSSFAVPTITNTTGTSPTGVSSQCAVCDNIPAGSGRDACKAQLHCQ
jgi:hypothetical protein